MTPSKMNVNNYWVRQNKQITYSLQKLSLVDLYSEFCENKSVSFSISDSMQMPAKKKSWKFTTVFQPKQRTSQLIQRIKKILKICNIHEIYRHCHERVINYYSRVSNCIDLQIVKLLISIRMQDLPCFLSSY